jgi:pimeloyl-ACP methyl ester carboxylesterase
MRDAPVVKGPATAERETATFLKAGENELLGVLTEPVGPAVGCGVVMMSGAHFTSSNRNRLSVHLARCISEQGFHSLRLDFHGTGESTGVLREYRLDRPFVQDAASGIAYLRSIGLKRFVLLGTCFGARTALATARDVEGMVGIALVSAPPRDFEKGGRGAAVLAENVSLLGYARRALSPRVIRNLRNPAKRSEYHQMAQAKVRRLGGDSVTGRSFREPLTQLIEADVRALLVYGSEDENLADFHAVFRDPVALGSSTEVALVDGSIAGFSSLAIQEQVLQVLKRWFAQLATRLESQGGSR